MSAPDLAVVPAFLPHDKVDILFVFGNEPSTGAYKNEVRARFPELVTALGRAGTTHPASYHIGIVTADLGAGPYSIGNGQCSPGGERGRLRIAPDAGSIAAPDCSSFSLGGVRFLDWDQAAGTTNVVGARDLPSAFDCMSSISSSGCGFQHPLESSYWALHENVTDNAGFLRDDALLVVVYVVDEDDCSGSTDDDLFDPSPQGVARYGTLHSFRCAQFGITCGDSPMPLAASAPGGPFDNCRPLTQAEGGKLIDVQKYIDYFSRPGGVKADPSDVILMSIAPPPTPFQWWLPMPCPDQPNTPQCPVLMHSCVSSPANPHLSGNPTVRLSAVVQSAATSQSTSSCETSYAPALADLAQKIIARLR